MQIQETIRELILQLVFVASEISGYSVPFNHDVAIQMTVGYDMKHCVTHHEDQHEIQVMPACYVFGTDTIFIRNRKVFGSIVLPDKTDATALAHSIIVHEIVHWLQEHNTDWGTSCEELIKREIEAYNVQRLFLKDHGIEMKNVTTLSCDTQ